MYEIMRIELIRQKIFMIRGHKVMIDRDLAELYGVETRVLNQAVRRNSGRFPDDFMFALTREEILNLSQIVISSRIKHAPNVFVFTEQGVAMLSSVLNSERAIKINIAIMRTFVRLREMLSSNKALAHKLMLLENRIEKHDGEIKAIFDAIRQLMVPPEKKIKEIRGFGKRGSGK
ncbi:MAG: ORF6N domain-containing protein [Nitrospirota bacterium]